jgi:hypothetical protein
MPMSETMPMSWCVKQRDEYGNRHDRLQGYMPPGGMCIQEVGPSYRSICCSDGLAIFCYTVDGAESYCTTEDRHEFVERFVRRYNELLTYGAEQHGATTIRAFQRY